MALEMRENGHLATAMSPDALIKHYIFMAHNWDISKENNKNGPEFINELIKKQLERINNSHRHLLDGFIPVIFGAKQKQKILKHVWQHFSHLNFIC